MSAELKTRVQELIDTMINPAVAGHGGFVELIDVQDNRVYLQMGGGCQGCGAADVTLKSGIERLIKEEIPEVAEVLDTTDHAAGTQPLLHARQSLAPRPPACGQREASADFGEPVAAAPARPRPTAPRRSSRPRPSSASSSSCASERPSTLEELAPDSPRHARLRAIPRVERARRSPGSRGGGRSTPSSRWTTSPPSSRRPSAERLGLKANSLRRRQRGAGQARDAPVPRRGRRAGAALPLRPRWPTTRRRRRAASSIPACSSRSCSRPAGA